MADTDTVRRFERGIAIHPQTFAKLKSTLENGGIAFLESDEGEVMGVALPAAKSKS